MPIEHPTASPSSLHSASPAPQKKEGGRVEVLAIAAAGRSITTRFLIGRDLTSGGVICIRLTCRGVHAAQFTYPARLTCLPAPDGTLIFERPPPPLAQSAPRTPPRVSTTRHTKHKHKHT